MEIFFVQRQEKVKIGGHLSAILLDLKQDYQFSNLMTSCTSLHYITNLLLMKYKASKIDQHRTKPSMLIEKSIFVM